MNPTKIFRDPDLRKTPTSPSDVVFQIASQNDNERLKTFFLQNNNINLFEIIDPRQYTLCHICCINNNLEMLKRIVEYINSNFAHISHKVVEWVNKKNSDGYTALHMASYKGNLKLIKFLEKMGADPLARNRHGFLNEKNLFI